MLASALPDAARGVRASETVARLQQLLYRDNAEVRPLTLQHPRPLCAAHSHSWIQITARPTFLIDIVYIPRV
jgi:hypothetical protein